MKLSDEVLNEAEHGEYNHAPVDKGKLSRWAYKVAELEAELAEAKRSEEIMEAIVEGVESVMSDIEPEIVYLPEAVKKMRDALESIIKHHDTMMNGALHTATWHIAKKALSEDV